MGKKSYFDRLISILTAMVIILTSFLFIIQNNYAIEADAISTDYPVQLMNIASKDNSKVLTENGTDDISSLSMKSIGNDLSASWRFDRVNTDSIGTFFKICNADSGRLLTPDKYDVSDGNNVIIYGSESAQSQHWYIIPVKQDHLGNDLYYKIVNYSDTNLALTQSTSGITLSKYSGADSQLWLLNADGLQGFAGYCKDDNTGNIKASDIGGLFGETVEVSSFDELKTYAESDTAYTIVVTKNISVTSLKLDSSGRYYCPDGRIYVHSNKTIIGSYSAHTMYNVQFCTASSKGTGNNLIIKNFELQHDSESNGNDSIVVYFGSGENLWVDHITFVGHSAVNTASTGNVDWDKFLACCYDADYCTVSDSSFGLHEYGVILGYPADDENSYNNYNNFPRMSIIGNRFNNTLTRGPGLMRYGYFHSMNNYVSNFSMAYTVHTASKVYAENCYYDGGTSKGNVICDWNSVTYPGSYAEIGSEFVNCGRTSIEGYAQNCTWRPTTNYDYTSLSASAAKSYCETYSGAQDNKSNYMYLRFAKSGIPSSSYTNLPSKSFEEEYTASEFTDGSTFMIKNVSSNLYMEVQDGKAENNANVQQWGADSSAKHNTWRFFSAGDGYYYIISELGDGATYALDIAGKKTADGTNISIYKFSASDNQKFMITKNSDGSYKIRTKITSEKSVIEVADASSSNGANIQQYQINGNGCQDWILESVDAMGVEMDTSVLYTFKNVNSSLVMDILNSDMTDGTNVQQYTSNDLNCQKWLLKSFGNNYYYIRSAENTNYALKAFSSANGGNIAISEYSTKDSSQLFKFSKNLDGSYSIMTRASKDKCLIETANASTAKGANIQQWEANGNNCQKWNAVTQKTTAATTTTIKITTTTTVSSTTIATTKAPATTVPVSTTKPVTEPTEPFEIKGDINSDGKTDISDVVCLYKYILKITSFTKSEYEKADISQDGKVDIADMILLKETII